MTTENTGKLSFTLSESLIKDFRNYAEKNNIKQVDLFKLMWEQLTVGDVENLDEIPNIEFSFPKEEREKKEAVFREIFGLSDDDPLKVSEKELLEKACEKSGKKVEDFSRNGRIMAAKQEIGQIILSKAFPKKGKRGSADDKLKANLQYLVDNKIKLSVNKLVQVENTYRPTVIRFLEDNGLVIGTNGELDPDAVDEFLERKKDN